MKTIKVGLIGTGYIGVVHLEILRRLGGVEVVAVADPNGDLARRTAERFGVPKSLRRRGVSHRRPGDRGRSRLRPEQCSLRYQRRGHPGG